MNLSDLLEKQPVHTSVPCRVDFGGTLDISTIYLSLMPYQPSSFNIALDKRTHVTLHPWKKGEVKVSSKGFDSAVFPYESAPFDHPMGLMFAMAKYFNVHGVHIHIESTSPPRSALGGSSSAAVAIASALYTVQGEPVDPARTAWLAHYVESSVAGVPCGVQDQLAAAFGGVNQWIWKMGPAGPEFEQQALLTGEKDAPGLDANILVAYCGIPHVSSDINGRWIKSYLKGESRGTFQAICDLTKAFTSAIKERNFLQAAALMNRETNLRVEMTPDVLDITGEKLFEKAGEKNCGARFTGAGGGGCLWAVGEKQDIDNLRPAWHELLSRVKGGKLLETAIDTEGIIIH